MVIEPLGASTAAALSTLVTPEAKARKLPCRELGGLKNAVAFPSDVQQMRREQGRDHIASLDTHRQKPRRELGGLKNAVAFPSDVQNLSEPWLNSGSLVELLETNIWYRAVVHRVLAEGVLVQGDVPQPWEQLVPRHLVGTLLRPCVEGDDAGLSHNDFCGVDDSGKVEGLADLASRGCRVHFSKAVCFLCSNCTLIWWVHQPRYLFKVRLLRCKQCLGMLGLLELALAAECWRCPVCAQVAKSMCIGSKADARFLTPNGGDLANGHTAMLEQTFERCGGESRNLLEWSQIRAKHRATNPKQGTC